MTTMQRGAVKISITEDFDIYLAETLDKYPKQEVIVYDLLAFNQLKPFQFLGICFDDYYRFFLRGPEGYQYNITILQTCGDDKTHVLNGLTDKHKLVPLDIPKNDQKTLLIHLDVANATGDEICHNLEGVSRAESLRSLKSLSDILHTDKDSRSKLRSSRVGSRLDPTDHLDPHARSSHRGSQAGSHAGSRSRQRSRSFDPMECSKDLRSHPRSGHVPSGMDAFQSPRSVEFLGSNLPVDERTPSQPSLNLEGVEPRYEKQATSLKIDNIVPHDCGIDRTMALGELVTNLNYKTDSMDDLPQAIDIYNIPSVVNEDFPGPNELIALFEERANKLLQVAPPDELNWGIMVCDRPRIQGHHHVNGGRANYYFTGQNKDINDLIDPNPELSHLIPNVIVDRKKITTLTTNNEGNLEKFTDRGERITILDSKAKGDGFETFDDINKYDHYRDKTPSVLHSQYSIPDWAYDTEYPDPNKIPQRSLSKSLHMPHSPRLTKSPSAAALSYGGSERSILKSPSRQSFQDMKIRIHDESSPHGMPHGSLSRSHLSGGNIHDMNIRIHDRSTSHGVFPTS